MKHSEYLNKKKDLIQDRGYLEPGLIDFYMRIFLVQEEFAAGYDNFESFKVFFRDGVFPVFGADSVVLDENTIISLSVLMDKIIEIISVHNNGLDFSLLKKNFIKDANFLLHSLLKRDYNLLEQKGLEYRLGLDELVFIVHNVFKPLVMGIRKTSSIMPEKEDWLESICPFCGYLPDMSIIVESNENRRKIHCSLCENTWEFPRLVCPACGCSDQKKHGFFEYEDNSVYRTYYCDECRHYIKNIRVPLLYEESSYDLSVEDIITNFLDSAMISKGYKRI